MTIADIFLFLSILLFLKFLLIPIATFDLERSESFTSNKNGVSKFGLSNDGRRRSEDGRDELSGKSC